MVSVIIFADGRAKAEIKEVSSVLADINGIEQIVVGDSSLENILPSISIFPTDGGSILESARLAVQAAQNERLLFINGGITPDARILKSIISDAQELIDNTFMYCDIDSNNERITLEGIETHDIITRIKEGSEWPLAIFATRRASIKDASLDYCRNSLELAAQLLFSAISAGAKVEPFSATIQMDAQKASMLLVPDVSSLAAMLGFAINTCAIEDLFPDHAWNEHPEESAAASYHLIAAMFIKLGDIQNALEALRLSDSLEESPRALALRGLIAQLQGETLGAVANMVSSLQQYEARKKDGAHYVSYQPVNIEVINSSLVSGLNALNKRENAQALDHFSKAVFNFDNFYFQQGLDRIRQ